MKLTAAQFEERVSAIRGEGRFFASGKRVYIARAPGRLDLMGGNVDYTGGLVFEATIEEATWAAAQLRDDGQIVLSNPQMKAEGWCERVELSFAELSTDEATRALVNKDTSVRWTAYVLGAFYLLRCRFPERVRCGANLYIESEVPLNKGVSSSAAIEVAVMKSVAAAYGLDLRGVELAELCQWTENVIAESACGIMDQAASVLGDEGYVLPLLCQPCRPLPLVKLPEGLRCWAIDSGVRHAVTGVEYEAARAAAFVGYRMICDWEGVPIERDESGHIPRFTDKNWYGYLSAVSASVFRSKYEWRLPEKLSGEEILATGTTHPDPFTTIRPGANYRVRNCTRYAVEENHRIELFVELARSANGTSRESAFRQMGELMFQSHWSYTECGLGCGATDELVELVRRECGQGALYGAKVTGGGAGGTVTVLGSAQATAKVREVVGAYAELRSFDPYVLEGSSVGADKFGIRVLPEIA